LGLIFYPGVVNAEMMRNDAIGNDPAKEKLCASRAKAKTVPFEIDSRYVERERSFHPDAAFVATGGISPQLVECFLREGTGRYEPNSFSPEQSYWHLIRPEQFKPGINTDQGREMAAKVCMEAVPEKLHQPSLDHSVYSAVVEIADSGPRYHSGASFAGQIANRYDIVVESSSFFRSAGLDRTAMKFTCLLSPILEIKSIQTR
jgi:hypothetical protein